MRTVRYYLTFKYPFSVHVSLPSQVSFYFSTFCLFLFSFFFLLFSFTSTNKYPLFFSTFYFLFILLSPSGLSLSHSLFPFIFLFLRFFHDISNIPNIFFLSRTQTTFWFMWVLLFSVHTFILRGGCPRGVMVKALNCGIVVGEFVLQSRYYVHFRANTLGKGMNPLILPAIG